MKFLQALFVLGLLYLSPQAAFAQNTSAGLTPCGAGIALSVTAASSNSQLSSCGSTVVVWNTGSNTAYLNWGTASGTTATTSGWPLPAGTAITLNSGRAGLYLAAITASSTTTLAVFQGNGAPSLAGGSGSGGGGGGGGTSSTFGAAFPSTGTAIGVKNGTNMVNLTADGSSNLNVNVAAGSLGITGNVTVVQGTGTNLHMVCDSGCSSSSAPADESAFTAGTTSQSPVGGFYQTTATSNALTNGQMGAFQVTANRALFTNLRNSSGTEIGTSANPVNVAAASGAIASGAVASGAIASGAFASGAVSSGAYASGSLASGAVVDLTNLSTPITPNTATATKGILLGGQYNSTQATFTNGQQGSVQLTSRGALMVNPGAEASSWAIGATASAVPANASYTGLSDGTNLRGWLQAANSLNTTGTGIGTAQVVGQCDDVSQTALTENQFGNARVDCTNHAVVTTPVPSATAGGTTLYTLTLAASTNATNVKNTPGQVYAISGFNMSSATPVWISLYDTSGTPTCGTSIKQQFLIPGSTTGTGFVHNFSMPKGFTSGIAFCATTGIAGTGSVSASTYVLNIDYK